MGVGGNGRQKHIFKGKMPTVVVAIMEFEMSLYAEESMNVINLMLNRPGRYELRMHI